jgi:hypothetical protein
VLRDKSPQKRRRLRGVGGRRGTRGVNPVGRIKDAEERAEGVEGGGLLGGRSEGGDCEKGWGARGAVRCREGEGRSLRGRGREHEEGACAEAGEGGGYDDGMGARGRREGATVWEVVGGLGGSSGGGGWRGKVLTRCNTKDRSRMSGAGMRRRRRPDADTGLGVGDTEREVLGLCFIVITFTRCWTEYKGGFLRCTEAGVRNLHHRRW